MSIQNELQIRYAKIMGWSPIPKPALFQYLKWNKFRKGNLVIQPSKYKNDTWTVTRVFLKDLEIFQSYEPSFEAAIERYS